MNRKQLEKLETSQIKEILFDSLILDGSESMKAIEKSEPCYDDYEIPGTGIYKDDKYENDLKDYYIIKALRNMVTIEQINQEVQDIRNNETVGLDRLKQLIMAYPMVRYDGLRKDSLERMDLDFANDFMADPDRY